MTKIRSKSSHCLKLRITFLIFVAGIVACTPNLRTEQLSPPITRTANTVLLATPSTSTQTVTPTGAIEPSPLAATKMRTPSVEAEIPILRTLNPSTVVGTPTRTIGDREDYIQQMLSPSTNCAPPCWWGLTPGVTSWQATQAFFYTLNAPIDWLAQKSYSVDTVIDHFIKIDISLKEDNSFLESILITGDRSVFPLSDDFPSYWQGYSPENVLKAYGPPTRVLLRSEALRGGDHHPFDLFMIYDDRGFVIYYEGFTQYGQETNICPRIGKQNNIFRLEILLQSTENSLPLERLGNWGYPDDRLKGFLPLEEATGMNVNEFYKVLTVEGQPGCIKTPAKIWKSNE